MFFRWQRVSGKQKSLTYGQKIPNRMCDSHKVPLDVGFRWLETAYPGFSVYLFSGKSHEQSNMNMKLVIMICTIQKVLVV